MLHPGSLPFGQAMVVVNGSIWTVAFLLFAVALPMLFPNGRLLSRRWAAVFVLAGIFLAMALVSNGLMPGHPTRFSQITNPLGVPSLAPFLQNMQNLALSPGLAVLIGISASLVVRFRRSRGSERQTPVSPTWKGRLDALGGGIVVDSAPGQGIQLKGHVPVLVGATSP